METISEPAGLKVTVDRVEYQVGANTPVESPHCFAYFISIHNDTEGLIQILGRKWVVRSDDGQVIAVEGDGVVGQFPDILPGEKFSYNSYHLLSGRSALAEGSYIGRDGDGQRVRVRIPAFEMRVP